jgi:hypothetical protein
MQRPAGVQPTQRVSAGYPPLSDRNQMDVRRLSVALLLNSVVACGTGWEPAEAQSTSSTAPRAESGPWVQVSGNAAIRVSLDTSRIVTAGPSRLVWLAFDLTEPWPPMDDIKAPYRHYQAQQELECSSERARGRAMRFVDVNGAVYPKPAPDSAWTGFVSHPLTPNLLRAVCRLLASAGHGP